jgi:thiol-disulfide isomerase/thioredoxin
MKIKRWLPWVVVLIVLMIIFARKKSVPVQNDAAGTDSFYNFTLTCLTGEVKTLADYQGSILIVDIWDTWCPPCKKEIPDFIELYSEYGHKGVEILGVAVGREGEQVVRTFISEHGINYENALVTDEFIKGVGDVQGIPTTFVIDQKGKLVRRYVGFTPKSDFEQDIRTLLSSK